MRIGVGADHGGFSLKADIIALLQKDGHEVIDVGAHTFDSTDDYPDFAVAVGKAIQRGEAERGILICGSGAGAAIAANKLRGIRAGVCHDTYSAHQGVEHDDMNVLCLGARVVGTEVAKELVQAFVGARLFTDPRFARRLAKVKALEG